MKLEWDATGTRFYEMGTDHGVLYLQDDKNEYSKGVAWNGLTAITESPSGADANDLWADNIKYGSIRAAEKFGCTVEAFTYPDEFAECDGSAEPIPGLSIGQQRRKPFGFSYRTEIHNDTASEKDDGYKIHLVYGATASPSDKGYTTINDSPDAITFSWEIDTTPVNVTGYKPTALMVVNTTKFEPEMIKKLEDILYGTEDDEARLPLPDEVISILGGKDPSEDTDIAG